MIQPEPKPSPLVGPSMGFEASRAALRYGYETVKEWLAGPEGTAAAALPKAEVTAIVVEFGTLKREEVQRANLSGRWLRYHGAQNPALARKVHADFCEAFYPSDPKWRAAALEHVGEPLRFAFQRDHARAARAAADQVRFQRVQRVAGELAVGVAEQRSFVRTAHASSPGTDSAARRRRRPRNSSVATWLASTPSTSAIAA